MPARDTSWRRATAGVAILVATVAESGYVAPAGEPGDAGAALVRFLANPIVPRQYKAWRRLDATGGGQRAWMEVQTEFDPESGMRVEILAEGGSGLIRSRVLRQLLDEEQELVARGATGTVAVDASNYAFTPEGFSDDGLARIAIRPLRKERALIEGTMLLVPADGTLDRIEGRLAKSPSFWMKRVDVTRSYERINGVLVPTSLESIAQLRFFGRSWMKMTYHYTEVDGAPVIAAY